MHTYTFILRDTVFENCLCRSRGCGKRLPTARSREEGSCISFLCFRTTASPPSFRHCTMPPHRASAAPVDDEPSKFVSESADRRRQFAEDGTETPRTAVNASKTFNAPEVPHHLSHREKEANAAGWRSEVQEIPKQRSFVIVYLALCLCVFLGK